MPEWNHRFSPDAVTLKLLHAAQVILSLVSLHCLSRACLKSLSYTQYNPPPTPLNPHRLHTLPDNEQACAAALLSVAPNRCDVYHEALQVKSSPVQFYDSQGKLHSGHTTVPDFVVVPHGADPLNPQNIIMAVEYTTLPPQCLATHPRKMQQELVLTAAGIPHTIVTASELLDTRQDPDPAMALACLFNLFK